MPRETACATESGRGIIIVQRDAGRGEKREEREYKTVKARGDENRRAEPSAVVISSDTRH